MDIPQEYKSAPNSAAFMQKSVMLGRGYSSIVVNQTDENAGTFCVVFVGMMLVHRVVQVSGRLVFPPPAQLPSFRSS